METAREAAERVLTEIRGPRRTQKQALSEAVAELQTALLAVGDIVLKETGEELTTSFSEEDLAYIGGYVGAISTISNSLSRFLRRIPNA